MNALPSAEQVRELLDYNKETGRLTWRVSRGCVPAGKSPTCKDSHGYVVVRLFRKLYRAHRVAWLIAYGEWPDNDIDHLNGDRGDNRIVNLRQVSRAENVRNRHASGAELQRTGRFQARIRLNGERKSLGFFETREQAEQAYEAAKRVLHPTYATGQGAS